MNPSRVVKTTSSFSKDYAGFRRVLAGLGLRLRRDLNSSISDASNERVCPTGRSLRTSGPNPVLFSLITGWRTDSNSFRTRCFLPSVTRISYHGFGPGFRNRISAGAVLRPSMKMPCSSLRISPRIGPAFEFDLVDLGDFP